MRVRLALVVLIFGVGFALFWRARQDDFPARPDSEETLPVTAERLDEEGDSASEAPVSAATAAVTMRVSLTNSARKAFQFSCSAPFEVYLNRDDAPLRTLEPIIREVDVKATSDATGIQLGAEALPANLIRLKTDASPDFWVNDHQYRGEIWFHLI